MNALIGAGHAHLAGGDIKAAAHAFRLVLEMMPANGRALVGLQQACTRQGRVSEAESLAARVQESIAELTKSGRLADAAMLAAQVEVARGCAKGAAEILEQLIQNAPPGQTGWAIAIDPAFASLQNEPAFVSALKLLAERA